MPRLAILIALIVLAGCKGPPAPPDDALAARLRVTVVGTLDAMAVPASARPGARGLDEQARLLAFQCDLGVVAGIEDGSLSAREVRAAADQIAEQFRAGSHGPTAGMSLPVLFTWLHARADTLSADRLVLLHALTRQAAREVGRTASGRRR